MLKTSAKLSLLQTEKAILDLKRHFEDNLAESLSLHRVSAPMFVEASSGIQDDLNGVEKPVSFKILAKGGAEYQIVHSLAKWKRLALARYKIPKGEGLYTDMNALRPDEPTISTSIHSVYVDQWDWEKAIDEKDRCLDFLKSTVTTIYATLVGSEKFISSKYDLVPFLPETIHFIHTEDLLEKYPDKTPKEREDAICKELGAVFLIGIGGYLGNGEIHDGRAPDYDDWTTPTSERTAGLNGDILVYNPATDASFEVSSMGIRVDKKALLKQLEIRGCTDRSKLSWHQSLLGGEMPFSIGGGIGQSRLCMLLLQKRHIGEVQVSVWPESVELECEKQDITLL